MLLADAIALANSMEPSNGRYPTVVRMMEGKRVVCYNVQFLKPDDKEIVDGNYRFERVQHNQIRHHQVRQG